MTIGGYIRQLQMIYTNIDELIKANPSIKTDPCKIRLINWRMGFGAAMTILLNNAAYLENINSSIVIEPLWNSNSKNFRYHDASLENSFYEYFTEKNPKDAEGLKTYTVQSTPHRWAKTPARPKGWAQDPEHIDYFKRTYKLNADIKDQVSSFLQKFDRPIYGVHFRSNKQKKIHYPELKCDVAQVCQRLSNKHKGSYFFVATDTKPYLQTAKSIFRDKLLYHRGILRVTSDKYDSMPAINAPCSLRFGYEILKDAYTLAQCDILYYSKSNVHFLTRLLGDNKNIQY